MCFEKFQGRFIQEFPHQRLKCNPNSYSERRKVKNIQFIDSERNIYSLSFGKLILHAFIYLSGLASFLHYSSELRQSLWNILAVAKSLIKIPLILIQSSLLWITVCLYIIDIMPLSFLQMPVCLLGFFKENVECLLFHYFIRNLFFQTFSMKPASL